MRLTIALTLILLTATSGIAGEADVFNVKIESLALITVPTGGHLAGNFEIKIHGGFAVPPGISCNSPHITTRKSTDPDGRMFALLQEAVTRQLKVGLRITDAPELTAYPGRCSLSVVRYCGIANKQCGE